jgi:hypothetical protein
MQQTVMEIRTTSRALLAILALAVSGTLLELVLLEHYEDWQQWIPLGALSITTLTIVWQAVAPSGASRRMFSVLMWVLLVAGLVGVVLHLRGNLEFEQELNPGLGGIPLWIEVLRGATPALAPGSLFPIALLGLLYLRMVRGASPEHH